jgi:Ca2+-binding RTX toxin-like protein
LPSGDRTPCKSTVDQLKSQPTIHKENLIMAIFGTQQGDTLIGDALRNVLFGFDGNDIIIASDDDDYLNGGNDNDDLNAGRGDDILEGGDGDDTLNGGQGNDILNGGSGSDDMQGEQGNDIYIIDDADVITEAANAGQDLVISSVGSYTLGDNVEDLILVGDGIIGFGNGLDNRIRGNDRTNTLNGQGGNDTLTGGASQDRFRFNAGEGIDTITDFVAGEDKIVLDLTSFSTLTSVVGPGFSVATEFESVAANADASAALIVYNASSGRLFYNENGAAAGFGTGGEFARLENAPSLGANDFTLIA